MKMQYQDLLEQQSTALESSFDFTTTSMTGDLVINFKIKANILTKYKSRQARPHSEEDGGTNILPYFCLSMLFAVKNGC